MTLVASIRTSIALPCWGNLQNEHHQYNDEMSPSSLQIDCGISEEIEDVFDQVIEDRKSKGLVIEAEYLGTRETRLTDATFDSATGWAEISVSYAAEMTSVVLDSDGNVIEGDSKQVKRQKDIWTFARDMSSNDPNWQLVATSE